MKECQKIEYSAYICPWNQWVCGLCQSSGFIITRQYDVSKTVPVSEVASSPHLKKETDPVSEILRFLII
jgi:hypothetical protein